MFKLWGSTRHDKIPKGGYYLLQRAAIGTKRFNSWRGTAIAIAISDLDKRSGCLVVFVRYELALSGTVPQQCGNYQQWWVGTSVDCPLATCPDYGGSDRLDIWRSSPGYAVQPAAAIALDLALW